MLPARLLNLLRHANADEPVVGLELLHRRLGVVDEAESGRLAATVLCAETEDGDLLLAALVELGQLGAEVILGDVGALRVEDITVWWKISASVSVS